MKNQSVLLVTILVLSIAAASCNGSQLALDPAHLDHNSSSLSQADTNAALRTISVTGNAEVRVVPDQVIITLGIETFDKDLATAKQQNDKIIRKAFDVIKEMKIEDKDVQTDFITIEPRYDNYYDKRLLLGYDVRKTIAITLRDVSKFDALLSSMIESGVNYVQGVDFRTTELRKHRDEARALALKAAEEKAIAMAAELDQAIGEPITINEEYSNWWSGYSSWWGYGMGNSQTQNVVQNSQGVQPDSENAVALGLISVNASVSVQFQLNN